MPRMWPTVPIVATTFLSSACMITWLDPYAKRHLAQARSHGFEQGTKRAVPIRNPWPLLWYSDLDRWFDIGYWLYLDIKVVISRSSPELGCVLRGDL